MATSKISESCVFICLLGLTSVIHVSNSVILFYSMPVGQTTKNGKVHYKDTSYDGVITNGFYKDGTGILTDGKFGPAFSKELKGEGWVGWNATLTQSQYIDITFEFSGMLKFTNVTLTVNVDNNNKRNIAVFNRSQIFFSSTEDSFSDTSFLQCYPRNDQAKNDSYNANVTLSLCENTARFMKLRLYFGGQWLLISEISFNSVPTSEDEQKSHQNCSGKTTTCLPIYTTTSHVDPKASKPKPGYDSETANSIAMFVGIAVTLAIVLIVLFVILIIYKRRRQASESPISVDRVGIENQAVEAETESPPTNNQGLDHAGSTSSRTTRYEDAKFISPLPVHVNLNRNRPDGRETANSDRSSGDVIPANGRIAPCEDVQIISPPSVHEMLNQNRPDGRELERTNSDRSSAYVISPANGKITPYRVVQIAPPSSVHNEHNRNRPDGRELETANFDRSSAYVIPPANGKITPYRVVQIAPPSAVHNEHNRNQSDGIETRNSNCSYGYEEVQISSLSGYTELDKNRTDETNHHTYQKFVKRDSAHAGEIKTTPGYTELDNTKRAQDDSASYQKLIKK